MKLFYSNKISPYSPWAARFRPSTSVLYLPWHSRSSAGASVRRGAAICEVPHHSGARGLKNTLK